MTKKRGRNRKEGVERFPCGKPKPAKPVKVESDAIAPTALHRICEDAELTAKNPELVTALGRLRLRKLISSAQAAAGFRLAEVHGRFGFYHEVRRIPKGPSYERGYGSSQAAFDEMDSSDQEVEAENRVAETFRALPTQQKGLPRVQRDQIAVVERVCIENEMPPAHQVPYLHIWLDILAEHFGIVKAGKKKKGVTEKSKAKDTPRNQSTPIIVRERAAFVSFMKTVRPDWDEEKAIEGFGIYKAMADRIEFRNDKAYFKFQNLGASNSFAAV